MEFIENEKAYVMKTFKSSSSDKIYSAGLYSRHNDCTCPGFINRGKCKHIDDLKKRYNKK